MTASTVLEQTKCVYWARLAAAYNSTGPPLRPSADDIALMELAVAACPGDGTALLLGVTPGIACMRWPTGTRLLAIDNTLEMAQAVWPGNIEGRRSVSCGDWCAIPVRDNSCTAIVGDGSLSMLRWPTGYHALAANAARALVAGGLLVLRCYLRPDIAETPEQVAADLSLPSFHYFKLRLMMAAQRNIRDGLIVDDLYRCWVDLGLDEQELVAHTGWEREAIERMELYRDSSTVYTFPTRREVDAVFDPFFEQVSVLFHGGCLADRCPTIVFRLRSGL